MAIQQSPFVAGSKPHVDSAALTRAQIEREQAERRAEQTQRERADKQKLIELEEAAKNCAPEDEQGRHEAQVRLWEERCRQGQSPGPKPLPPISDPLIPKAIRQRVSDGLAVLEIRLNLELDGKIVPAVARFTYNDLRKLDQAKENVTMESYLPPSGPGRR